jgi:hypothetical protein
MIYTLSKTLHFWLRIDPRILHALSRRQKFVFYVCFFRVWLTYNLPSREFMKFLTHAGNGDQLHIPTVLPSGNKRLVQLRQYVCCIPGTMWGEDTSPVRHRPSFTAGRHLTELSKLVWFSPIGLAFPELFSREKYLRNWNKLLVFLCFSTYEFLHTFSILHTNIAYVCVYKYFSLFDVLFTETPMGYHISLSY